MLCERETDLATLAIVSELISHNAHATESHRKLIIVPRGQGKSKERHAAFVSVLMTEGCVVRSLCIHVGN